MKPPDNVRKFFKNAAIETNPGMDEAVLDKVLTAHEGTKNIRSASMKANMGRRIMRSPITKLAAAVVMIIAVYYVSRSIKVTAPVFADVVEQIHRARSVSYKHTFFPGESWESTTTEMITESGAMRSEQINGDILISDLSIGKTLHLMPDSKRATLTQRAGRPREGRLFNYLDWISTIHEQGVEFAGQKKVNGKMTNVFVGLSGKTTVWVDPDANLPVRVEMIIQPNPITVPETYLTLKDFGGEDDTARNTTIDKLRAGSRIPNELKTVMSDFVWNAKIDESLFSLEPPKEYTVEEEQFDTARTRRNSLIQALVFWAEMSGGMFPSKIDNLGDPNMIRPMLIEKFDKDGDPAEELGQAVKQLDVILKGLSFAQSAQKKVDRGWHYAGDGVRLGDGEKAIFWSRSKDPEAYRVVYGDLSARKVASENLPK
ncbi:MAG: hypothetical protein JSW66_03830 [Phycisphaerales bacterium]|nr:MAG: hypothetical protein JSW66_03830 [Phycisphaerales bacterium]